MDVLEKRYERLEGSACPACDHVLWRDDRHDVELCPRCDVWLGAKCRDPGCGFCAPRPPRPGAQQLLERSAS